jgi:hypothetical protein
MVEQQTLTMKSRASTRSINYKSMKCYVIVQGELESNLSIEMCV